MELADVTDSKSVGSNTVWVRVPPPAPNTEAPVGCLCVWLSRTGLEAGETKRSCGAFCLAGERKQSGRAARSASKGRFERRVPPPAPNTEAPVGCLCVWLSRTGLEAGEKNGPVERFARPGAQHGVQAAVCRSLFNTPYMLYTKTANKPKTPFLPLSVDRLIRQSPKYAIQITPGI